jgi:hypothetical protein
MTRAADRGSITDGSGSSPTPSSGPYGRLSEAHRAIREWCASEGHVLAGPRWEIYGHWIDEWNDDPCRIRTDVFYLVRTDAASSG